MTHAHRVDDPFAAGSALHERFAESVSATPDAIAVRDGGLGLTYRDIDEQSTKVAARLAEAGIARGSLVALRLPRTAIVPIAILGVFKHGCPYVPVDPDYPTGRQEFILADSGAHAVLTATEAGEVTIEPTGATDGPALPDGLAYVIYTSGSTGTPKGVLVGHQQVIALLTAADAHYGFGRDDVWSLFSAYSFDVSVWEMWGALLFGGRLVVVPATCVKDPPHFAALLAAEGVTILNQVPTAFTYLVRALEEQPMRLDALRHIVFAGEDINKDAITRWWRLGLAPAAILINMYGITETTVHTTYEVLTPETLHGWDGQSPIGRPLSHLDIHLRDETGKAVPAGVPGEIIVSGTGVAFGYLNRPDLTEQRFVRLDGVAGLTYRSGDWALRDERGQLFFIGRRDFQVQIRGFRIELGEIEARIAEHPAVGTCVVTAPTNVLGEPVLTAHITVAGEAETSTGELRRHAAAALPRHMVPARFFMHTTLPLTHNGKVDRKALDAVSNR